MILSGNIVFSGVASLTYMLGTLLYDTGNLTFTGSTIIFSSNISLDLKNLTVNNLTISASAKTVNLNSNLIIQGAFTSIVSTSAAHNIIKSNVAGTQRKLTFLAGSTMDFSFVNATDIDSSDGLPVFTHKGTLSNTKNWNLMKTYARPSGKIYLTE